jgi:benzoyl-CoA reductase/2-hydroxyglutaryl-CoA dehydratase subunit BcrC/BadD/HgdB
MIRLRAQSKLKSILKDYYAGLSSPLAWCTSAGPAEILRALGFHVYFPENHGALLGATRAAGRFIPCAHQAGYDDEICSYLTADIGAYLMHETPLAEAYGMASIPRPDLIVFNTNQCREVAEWFGFYGREFGCPTVGIFPPRHMEEVTEADIDNVAWQFERLIRVGEQVAGASLAPERLAETVKLSRLGSDLWNKVLETGRIVPSLMTFWDGAILMAPIVLLRGTQVCIDFYQEALLELQALADCGAAAVPGARVRIYWEGMPIWGRLRALSELFAENQAAVVASTYCSSWVFPTFDPRDPLRSMADAYTRIFINRGEEAKLAVLARLLEEYRIDGIIFHDSKTCSNNTNSRFGLPGRLTRATSVPSLIIDGDLNDLRFFSDGQARTRIETFIEQLKTRQQCVKP